jgi:chemotaxis regulatin CheY-phosphate phosphatase CheZ
MTVDERLDRLTGIVEALAASVVAHDNQIDALVKVAEKQQQEMKDLVREWQAYLRTLPKQ